MKRFACLLSTFLLVTFGLPAVVTQTLLPDPAVPTRPSHRLSHLRKLIEQENWKEVILQFRGSLKNGEITDINIEKLAKHYYKTKLGAALAGQEARRTWTKCRSQFYNRIPHRPFCRSRSR